MRWFALLLASTLAWGVPAARATPSGRVVGHVAVTDARGRPVHDVAVIVYIVGFNEPADPDAPPARIVQQDRRFVPELIAVTVGSRVTFPNDDPFLHNVFSQSSRRPFDLGSYPRGRTKTEDFPDAGVVDVYCNIHPGMAATILVLPNRRFASVAPDGSFAIPGVPPGTWTVFAYTRRARTPASAKVTVAGGRDTQVDLALVRGAEPPHLNKYGERYRDAGGTFY